MPPARPPLDVEELREIWRQCPAPVVRRLLWEVRRLRDENARLRKVCREMEAFETAVNVRGGLNGDVQLHVFWNRARSALEEKRESGWR